MDIEKINEFLEYNPTTGSFKWKRRSSNRIRVGDEAGVVTAQGYKTISVLGNKVYAHRLAWMVTYNEIPDCIDHINGDRLDNRIENLRNTTKGGEQSKQECQSFWRLSRRQLLHDKIRRHAQSHNYREREVQAFGFF